MLTRVTVFRAFGGKAALALASCAVGFAMVELLVRLLFGPPARVRLYEPAAPLPASITETAEASSEAGWIALRAQLYVETPTGRRLRPNTLVRIEDHPTSHKNFTIRTNSLGHRHPELGAKTRPRVLFLGDSITASHYLPEEETFVHQVGRVAEQRGLPIEVINAGVGAVGLGTQHAILLESGLDTDPDVVVLGFYLNDVQDSPGVGLAQIPRLLRWSSVVQRLVRHYPALIGSPRGGISQETWRVWRKEVVQSFPPGPGDPKRDAGAFNRVVQRQFLDWGSAWSAGAWLRMRPTFDSLASLSERYGFELVFVAFPVRLQVESEHLRDAPQQSLRAIADELGVPLLDLLPILRTAQLQAAEPLYYDHCHLTAYGGRVVAERIFSVLRSALRDRVPASE